MTPWYRRFCNTAQSTTVCVGGGGASSAALANPSTHLPTRIKKVILGGKLSSIEGARNWRPILVTQTFVRPPTHPHQAHTHIRHTPTSGTHPHQAHTHIRENMYCPRSEAQLSKINLFWPGPHLLRRRPNAGGGGVPLSNVFDAPVVGSAGHCGVLPTTRGGGVPGSRVRGPHEVANTRGPRRGWPPYSCGTAPCGGQTSTGPACHPRPFPQPHPGPSPQAPGAPRIAYPASLKPFGAPWAMESVEICPSVPWGHLCHGG